MKKSLPFIIAGVIAWIYWAKGKAIDRLQFYIKGIGTSIQAGQPVITLSIAIQNPTNETFTIRSVVGNLSSNGQVIGRVTSNSEVFVQAAGQSLYPLNIALSIGGLGLAIYNLISQGIGTSQTIGFSGAVNASGIVAPIDITATIG